jgi:hypothetical protein
MTQNNLALSPQSSGKDRANEKTYRIPVSTGIFEHCPDMLDSVWLFLWYIDRTTKENGGEGRVLGGVPIIDSEPAHTLRVPVKKIRRWRAQLVRQGYIRALRTPYGHVVTLLKSKKWNWAPTLLQEKKSGVDLPKREISPAAGVLERSRLGESTSRSGQSSAQIGQATSLIGKYKEDRTKTLNLQGQNSRQNSESTGLASPLKSKPSGKAKTQLGFAQSEREIAQVMAAQRGTIAHYLAEVAKSSYYTTKEQAQKQCAKMVDAFTSAFAAIEYPFDLSSTVLGYEFCENVKTVVEASASERPRPKKWVLCERIIDRCDQTWDDAQIYSDVRPPYWPPDFNDHTNRLFSREEPPR